MWWIAMLDKTLIKFETNELKSLLAAQYFIDSKNIVIVDRKKRFSLMIALCLKEKVLIAAIMRLMWHEV